MRFLGLLLMISSCLRNGPPDQCIQDGLDQVEQLVNPATLQCQTFSTYQCDPSCGPCPAIEEPAPPDWGECTSTCTGLDEAACGTTSGCWIARDWTNYYSNAPSYLACYAVATIEATGACAGLDADACASRDDCSGLYQTVLSDCAGCTNEETYKECIPENQQAGTCGGATCLIAPPTCPSGTTPGADGCWTGSCIPDQFCGTQPL